MVTTYLCTRADCTFGSTGGRCAKGLADPVAEACSDLRTQADNASTQTILKASQSVEARVPMPSADELDAQGAYRITSAQPSVVVLVSGLAGSGKTTLLTSIYDRLQAGPLGDFYFSGCESPLAFERWCHDARLASNRDVPETLRTPLLPPGEGRFLHLRLARSARPGSFQEASETWAARDILFTDLPGEIFEHIRDNAAAVDEMPVFRRADHFVQLVDGDLLRFAESRHGAVADTKNILRSYLSAGVLSKRTAVHLVVTKWDLVRNTPSENECREFFDSVSESVKQMVSDKVVDYRSYVSAARTPTTAPVSEWGLMGMILDWFRPTHTPVFVSDVKVPNAASEFDRFETRGA